MGVSMQLQSVLKVWPALLIRDDQTLHCMSWQPLDVVVALVVVAMVVVLVVRVVVGVLVGVVEACATPSH